MANEKAILRMLVVIADLQARLDSAEARNAELVEALHGIAGFEWDDGDEGGAALSMRLAARSQLSTQGEKP